MNEDNMCQRVIELDPEVAESRFPVWSLILSRGVEQWRRSPGISGGSP